MQAAATAPDRAQQHEIEKSRLEWGRKQSDGLWTNFCAQYEPIIRNQTVLDFGCSWGYFCKYLVDRFSPRRVIGVDISPGWDGDHGWNWHEHADKLSFVAGDITEIDNIPPGSIDLIIAISVFQYIAPDKLETTLERLYSLLRPGGEMLVRTRVVTSYIGADLHQQFALPYVHLLYPRRFLNKVAEARRGGPVRYLNSLSASSYLFLFHRAGFEIADANRRMNRAAPEILQQVREKYPFISEEELSCAEIDARLLRPYEPDELDTITSMTRTRVAPGSASRPAAAPVLDDPSE
ncbi:MAG: class I SAM-dependent methyltransferase [Alphaproteobacteria bacterium]|nr:class I SAM-dependent methyltransferase [Alphaproteobacteria bacterium]